MTTQENLIRKKESLLELAEYLQNVSQACKIHGVSRQHFYDIRTAYEEQGLGVQRGQSVNLGIYLQLHLPPLNLTFLPRFYFPHRSGDSR